MKPLIFFDFDGVLCTRKTYLSAAKATEGYFAELGAPACVAALNRTIATTGADIVVSSTWRLGGRDCIDQLKTWGVQGLVLGMTPHLEGGRGYDIQAYLDENPCDNFVILDAYDDMGHLRSRWVQTTFELGLTEEIADKAIALLRGGK